MVAGTPRFLGAILLPKRWEVEAGNSRRLCVYVTVIDWINGFPSERHHHYGVRERQDRQGFSTGSTFGPIRRGLCRTCSLPRVFIYSSSAEGRLRHFLFLPFPSMTLSSIWHCEFLFTSFQRWLILCTSQRTRGRRGATCTCLRVNLILQTKLSDLLSAQSTSEG